MRSQRDPGDHAQRAAAAAFQPPEQIRVGARVGDTHHAVRGDDLGLQQAGGGQAVAFGKTAEAATLDQSCHTHRHAAAALNIAARLDHHGVVDFPPPCAGFDRHRRLRFLAAGTAFADETIMELDGAHRPRPDHQRVRRVRGALVTVATALHHQAQVLRAGEFHRRNDIGGLAGGNGIGAR